MAQYKLKVGKVGQTVVDTHKKIENAFVDKFLEKVEDEDDSSKQ